MNRSLRVLAADSRRTWALQPFEQKEHVFPWNTKFEAARLSQLADKIAANQAREINESKRMRARLS